MKKFTISLFMLGLTFIIAKSQVGIGTASIDASAEDNQKALLLNRVPKDSNIATPVDGMIMFNSAQKYFKGYQDGKWVDITTCNCSIETTVVELVSPTTGRI